jgi:AcrR family transcriptional regulator
MNILCKTNKRIARKTYRHGDLHHAILECAIQLARKGGADAVVLREIARQVGVTPNAAYRHFADRKSLLQAVGMAAQSELANVIENEIAATKKSRDKAKEARAKFRAVGVGYIKFA